jgi:hypothetical protein
MWFDNKCASVCVDRTPIGDEQLVAGRYELPCGEGCVEMENGSCGVECMDKEVFEKDNDNTRNTYGKCVKMVIKSKQGKNFAWWIFLIIGLTLLTIIIISIIIFVLFKRKKKEKKHEGREIIMETFSSNTEGVSPSEIATSLPTQDGANNECKQVEEDVLRKEEEKIDTLQMLKKFFFVCVCGVVCMKFFIYIFFSFFFFLYGLFFSGIKLLKIRWSL